MYSVKTPQSGGKSRRHFSPAFNGPSVLSPAKRSLGTSMKSRNLSQNWTVCQTSILEETTQHSVVVYGNALPVLVTEAVTSRGNVDISVKLEECGWASLVFGRRLFIWKYKMDVEARHMMPHCRELTLPPSELAHKAELVHIAVQGDSQMPSVLAVSPEGIVRYWPNIMHEGLSAEASTDMSGQECYLLTSVHPLGCVVATTTCSLVLITPTAVDGQHSIVCRTLKFPQSVLAGISRRVSSFIFGGLPSQVSENKQLVKILSSEGVSKGECFLYLLSSNSLQKWCLIQDEPDELIFEQDLDRCLKEQFLKTVYNNEATQVHHIKSWCLDMQLTQSGVVVLAAAVNPSSAPFVYFAFGFFDMGNEARECASFRLIKHCEKYQMDTEESLLDFRFIMPHKNSQMSYMYSSDKIFCVPAIDINAELDIIEMYIYGCLFGAGTCNGLPLFFTSGQGLISIQHPQANLLNTSLALTAPPKELLPQEQPVGELADSLPHRFRSAICLYYNHKIDECEEMVNEMFPVSALTKANLELDSVVVNVSTQIIDDYPVSDPRWCESVPTGDSVSSSLIILHQLDDKLRAHDYLLNFLKGVGLYDRLSTVKVGENRVSTKVVLCEHSEKLVMAKIVRRFVMDYTEMLNDVINENLSYRKIEMKSHLTNQDLFFREVSEMHTFFQALVDWEERTISDVAQDVINIILNVNTVFVGVLTGVLQYRQSKAHVYGLPENETKTQYLPWTSSEGPSGIRTLTTRQHSINVQYMMKVTDNIEVQGVVYQQLMDMINFLLDGYASQLESLKGTDEYCATESRYKKERNRLIRPLVEVEQFERAAALAEKYMDFDILVEICELGNLQERLQRYTIQFEEQNFSDFMFRWYLDKGMRNKLLELPFGQQDLSRFLQNHEELSWLHHIGNAQYDKASQTLKKLALAETQFLNRKKTLASLGKLTALASDLIPNVKNKLVETINLEQDLITHQENLPDSVVEAYGLDPETMRVLSPEELIEMYISDENVSANAFDFKIALELLQFLKKPPGDSDYENLRLHIWCKAILRDNWEDLDTTNPLETVRETVFFQVIELAFDQGVDLHSFIIPEDDLLQSSELEQLAENQNFVFLLKAGYEHIYRLLE